MDSDWIFTWIILPLLIALSRVVDVSFGTLRIIFLHRGKKLLVPILGFFEIFIWLIVIREIMQNLTNILYYIAYAGGFAIGNFVGILIEEKLALGNNIIRIVSLKNSNELIEKLKDNGFGYTMIDAKGSKGDAKIIFTVIKRKDKVKVIELINNINPHTFYTIDDVQLASEEIFPLEKGAPKLNYYRWLFLRRRKEK